MLQVKSPEDASQALSYFNHFHDAFIESIVVKVIPENPGGFGFALPVVYDATLRFAHSNYSAAKANGGSERRIEMRLARVRRMSIGDMVAVDNMLQGCLVEVDENGTIHLDVDGDGLITFACEELTIEELKDP